MEKDNTIVASRLADPPRLSVEEEKTGLRALTPEELKQVFGAMPKMRS